MRLILFLCVCTFTTIFAQGWETSWDTATGKALKQNKKILLVFSGSDWCIPCIKLEKELWDNEIFISYSANNLSCYRADFPKRKKNQLAIALQQQHDALAEQYNPKGYFPWVVVLSASKEILGYFSYERLNVEDYIDKIEAF